MTNFEREKTDENINRKYENSYNIDIIMMRKSYVTLSQKFGKFGENPKKTCDYVGSNSGSPGCELAVVSLAVWKS